jgi:hypothetical protein
MHVFIIVALLAFGQPSAPSLACPGSQAINTSIGGSNDHADQISNVLALRIAGKDGAATSNVITYEYQTYGGAEFLEFNVKPPTFTKLVNGDVFSAFNTYLTDYNVNRSSLPPPFDSISSATLFKRYPCSRTEG